MKVKVNIEIDLNDDQFEELYFNLFGVQFNNMSSPIFVEFTKKVIEQMDEYVVNDKTFQWQKEKLFAIFEANRNNLTNATKEAFDKVDKIIP